MAKIGLIDVDGGKFPNLALMRLSAWHKSQGDDVGWWWGWDHYDRVYMSKVFSADYSPDADEPVNADEIVKGGTGYAIALENGVEVYDKSKDPPLPKGAEEMAPDYSIYPQYDFAISMTSRGCPRGCGFCHVAAKEGQRSIKVADVGLFWHGQKMIVALDPNITACREKRDLLRQYKETNAMINFNQGLDIRLLNDDDINDLNGMRLHALHFAWDNPDDDLTDRFQAFAKKTTHQINGKKGMVYCLTNYGDKTETEHLEQVLFRVYKLREMAFDPFIMVYDKPHAPQKIIDVQRWCNNKFIFGSCPNFEEYKKGRERR